MIDTIFELEDKLSDLEYDLAHFTDVTNACKRWINENRDQPVFIFDAVVSRCCRAEEELKDVQRRFFKMALTIEEVAISAIQNEIEFGPEHSNVTYAALREKLTKHHKAQARILKYIANDEFPEYGE